MKEEKYIPEGHHDIEVWYIGTIIFPDTLLQEAEFSGKTRLNLKSLGECKVEVYSNEGTIPHFHIFKPDHSFETCICIYSPNFFPHGLKYEGVLNSSQCKILDKYLRQPSKQDPEFSVWRVIRLYWEANNSNLCKFPDNLKTTIQPDYTRMNSYKSK